MDGPALSSPEATRCAAIAERAAGNFRFSFWLLPRGRRRAMGVLYAFSRLADDVADGAADPRDKAEALAALRAFAAGARAPDPAALARAAGWTAEDALAVLLALPQLAAAYPSLPPRLAELVEGCETDLRVRRIGSFRELYAYCYKVAAVVGLACLPVFGARGREADERAIDLGIALQLTNILRDVAEDAARDRIYLPADERAAFGVDERMVLEGRLDGRMRALMRLQAERARAYFQRGRLLMPLVPARTRSCPAMIMNLYRAILAEIVRRDYDVFSARVRLGAAEKVALLGLTAARAALYGRVGPRRGLPIRPPAADA